MSDETENEKRLTLKLGGYAIENAQLLERIATLEEAHSQCQFDYDTLAARRNAQIAELRAEIERLSPPLAPVLEWRQADDKRRIWLWKSGLWSIVPANMGGFWLRHGDSHLKHCDTENACKSLASSIQRLLDQ
jgi:hypothetical protein